MTIDKSKSTTDLKIYAATRIDILFVDVVFTLGSLLVGMEQSKTSTKI